MWIVKNLVKVEVLVKQAVINLRNLKRKILNLKIAEDLTSVVNSHLQNQEVFLLLNLIQTKLNQRSQFSHRRVKVSYIIPLTIN